MDLKQEREKEWEKETLIYTVNKRFNDMIKWNTFNASVLFNFKSQR